MARRMTQDEKDARYASMDSQEQVLFDTGDYLSDCTRAIGRAKKDVRDLRRLKSHYGVKVPGDFVDRVVENMHRELDNLRKGMNTYRNL
jgi:hypothetical protein